MASKEGVVLYYEILEQLEDLTDEQFGKVMRAIIKYDKTGQISEFDDISVKISFKCVKPTIDRNKEKYQNKCEMQRQKIIDYWNKRKEEEQIQLNTIEYNGIQKNTDKDKEQEQDIIINNKKNVWSVANEIQDEDLKEAVGKYLKAKEFYKQEVTGEQLTKILDSFAKAGVRNEVEIEEFERMTRNVRLGKREE